MDAYNQKCNYYITPVMSVKPKFSGVSFRSFQEPDPSDSGISETLSTNRLLPTQELFDPVLLDKDFQCTSATALLTSEKGDIASLKCYLFEEGN